MSGKDASPMVKPTALDDDGLNAYDKVIRWASMHMPGAWRLRLDILMLAYVVLFFGAVFSPIVFFGWSGPDDQSYDCVRYRYEAEASRSAEEMPNFSDAGQAYRERVSKASSVKCAGIDGRRFVWTKGFSKSEQSGILFWNVTLSAAFVLVWAFFVARGSRLRDVVRKTDAPGFATCILSMTPFVVFPVLAGHVAFAASHGDVLRAVLQGEATYFIPNPISTDNTVGTFYFPSSRFNSSYSLAVLTIGAGFALLLAAILKIVMYDGVVGLLRVGLLAVLVGAPSVVASVSIYSVLNGAPSGSSSTTAVVFTALLLLLVLAVVWLIYKVDSWRGVRRKKTRPLALSFLVLWPLWFAFASVAMFAWIQNVTDYRFGSGADEPWVVAYFLVCFVVGVLIETRLFRDVAKITLLPRP